MKVAVVYNRQSQRVINTFGRPNLEKYNKKSVARIVDSLKKHGHQVAAFEGDKDLIDALEEFMPRVIQGERPGMVFNLSYGIQGNARYTHVPGILEMIGIPYVGSGPVAHGLALDKVVAKMIFLQQGIPTPAFAVLETPEFEMPPDLEFPLIVKPRNESVSFGIKVVQSEAELREAAGAIFDKFQQAVLVEAYIDGREINVGIIGNGSAAEALPPAELVFGDGPRIYTEADKKKTSGREVVVQCPANLTPEAEATAQEISLAAFRALGCADCARVDLRMDSNGKLYVLEINSLPSLGEHGSYVQGAEAAGLDFASLCNRLVEVASTRYFGTPVPPTLGKSDRDPGDRIFTFLTQRRERLEQSTRDWALRSTRSDDPVGIRSGLEVVRRDLKDLGLVERGDLSDFPEAIAWETRAGLESGTLLVAHIDVPLPGDATIPYRREPERLFGVGIASSAAPLAMIEHAIRALRSLRILQRCKLGVLVYSDEGRSAELSAERIRAAATLASRVIVLHPASEPDRLIVERRGLRTYRVEASGRSRKPGQAGTKPDLLPWFTEREGRARELGSRKERTAVATGSLQTTAYRELLPRAVRAELFASFSRPEAADQLDARIREIFGPDRSGWRASVQLASERPPMADRKANKVLSASIRRLAERWDIKLKDDSSLLPSVAGVVPMGVPVLCGFAPPSPELLTAQESVSRVDLLQRTLLLASFLADATPAPSPRGTT